MAKKVRLPYFEDEGVHNNAQDAFRHAYTSAVISRDWGILRAQEFSEMIELTSPNTEAEHWMDRRNNMIGREVGALAVEHENNPEWTNLQVAQEIKRRIDSGEVVVTPYDPRRMFEKHVDWKLAKHESAEALQNDWENELKKAKDYEDRLKTNRKFERWEQARKWEIQRQEKRQNEEKTQRKADSDQSSSAGQGEVFVHAYDRRNGEVRSHSRTRPDGDPSNNRS